jgi:hypothetical protein
MATRLRIVGADGRANSSGLSLPITRGVVACHFLDGAAEAVRNRIDGQEGGAVFGAPTWSDGYGSFTSSTDRMNTGIVDADLTDVTFIVVARSSSAFSASGSRPMLIGTYHAVSANLFNCCIHVTGTPSAAPAATVSLTVSRNNGGAPANETSSITVADFSEWTILVGTAVGTAAANGRKLYDKTNAVSAVGTPTSDRLPHSDGTRTFQLGGTSSTLIGGQVDCAAGLIHNVVLTEAEIDLQVAGIRRRLLAYHGIVC